MAKINVEVSVNLREFADRLVSTYRKQKTPILRVYLKNSLDQQIINNNFEGVRRYLRPQGIGSFRALNHDGGVSVVLVPYSLSGQVDVKKIAEFSV